MEFGGASGYLGWFLYRCLNTGKPSRFAVGFAFPRTFIRIRTNWQPRLLLHCSFRRSTRLRECDTFPTRGRRTLLHLRFVYSAAMPPTAWEMSATVDIRRPRTGKGGEGNAAENCGCSRVARQCYCVDCPCWHRYLHQSDAEHELREWRLLADGAEGGAERQRCDEHARRRRSENHHRRR